MENVALNNINNNLIGLRKEIERLSEIIEEENLDLNDDVKEEIENSRKLDSSKFKTQEDLEKEFL